MYVYGCNSSLRAADTVNIGNMDPRCLGGNSEADHVSVASLAVESSDCENFNG